MASGRLRIRLLGGLDLRQDEVALPPLGSARAESLLAFLLLHQEAPQPRQHLAFLLWPDSSEGQARTNLRHLLHVLRRALLEPDRFLEVTPRTLRWRPDAPCWLDVAAFDAAVARSEREPGGSEAALSEAVELYAGDLLQGSYDEWLAEERERLRQRYLQALERLVELLEARGDLPAATRRAERLLREDPLREPTYQALMRLHDARGDRARALRVYHACAATLARELGVEPSAATRRAYASLLPPRVEPATPDQPSPLGPAGAAPLIGRAGQRASLVDLWRRSERGAAQLALVTGEPGAGKTRLVEELRAWCARSGAATAEARSYPAEGALAYGPVVAWLRSAPLAIHRPRARAALGAARRGRQLRDRHRPRVPAAPGGPDRARRAGVLAAGRRRQGPPAPARLRPRGPRRARHDRGHDAGPAAAVPPARAAGQAGAGPGARLVGRAGGRAAGDRAPAGSRPARGRAGPPGAVPGHPVDAGRRSPEGPPLLLALAPAPRPPRPGHRRPPRPGGLGHLAVLAGQRLGHGRGGQPGRPGGHRRRRARGRLRPQLRRRLAGGRPRRRGPHGLGPPGLGGAGAAQRRGVRELHLRRGPRRRRDRLRPAAQAPHRPQGPLGPDQPVPHEANIPPSQPGRR
jgi:DNA-binding SARP family transcriptional activator